MAKTKLINISLINRNFDNENENYIKKWNLFVFKDIKTDADYLFRIFGYDFDFTYF